MKKKQQESLKKKTQRKTRFSCVSALGAGAAPTYLLVASLHVCPPPSKPCNATAACSPGGSHGGGGTGAFAVWFVVSPSPGRGIGRYTKAGFGEENALRGCWCNSRHSWLRKYEALDWKWKFDIPGSYFVRASSFVRCIKAGKSCYGTVA